MLVLLMDRRVCKLTNVQIKSESETPYDVACNEMRADKSERDIIRELLL